MISALPGPVPIRGSRLAAPAGQEFQIMRITLSICQMSFRSPVHFVRFIAFEPQMAGPTVVNRAGCAQQSGTPRASARP